METIYSTTIHKDYTILEVPNTNPYESGHEFMYFKTVEGINHDADCDQDGFFYTGNCTWTSTLEDAMSNIDEISEL